MAGKTLGQRLREGRERMGLSQTQVATISSISNTNISNYERDFRKPDLETLVQLASLYGQNLDYLIKGEVQHIPQTSLWELETNVIKGYFETKSGALKTEMVMVPILSKLRPSTNELDFDEVSGYIPVIARDLDLDIYEYVAFVVQDDAMMQEGIRENSVVLIRQNNRSLALYIDGSIRLVEIRGRLTLRRVFKNVEVFALQAANPSYAMQFVRRKHTHDDDGDPVSHAADAPPAFGEVIRVMYDLSVT